MPREQTSQVTHTQVYTPISEPQEQQLIAHPVDQYMAPIADPTMLGLVTGLSHALPSLTQFLHTTSQVQGKQKFDAGKAARQMGQPLPPNAGEWFTHGYNLMDGQVAGETDGAKARADIEAGVSGYDRDGSVHINDHISKVFENNLKGLTNKSFLEGYNSSITPHIEGMRTDQLKYQHAKVAEKVQGNMLSRITTAFTQAREMGAQLGLRADGTEKGWGHLGAQIGDDGKVMTEYSVGITSKGVQKDVPSIVPGTTAEELAYIKSGKGFGPGSGPLADAIVQRAADWNRSREDAGKSPFASFEETPVVQGIIDKAMADGKVMGLSGTQMNELLFQSVHTIAQRDADPSIYKILQRPRADGTPSIYDIHHYREKIVHGIITTGSAAISKSKANDAAAEKQRDDAQSKEALAIGLLFKTNPRAARARWDLGVKNGTFAKAEDYVKYKRLWEEIGDTTPSTAEQRHRETALFRKAYSNEGLTEREILDSNLPTSSMTMLINAKNNRQAGKEITIYQNYHFKNGEDYIKDSLKSKLGQMDVFGDEKKYDDQQLAGVISRYTQAALKVKDPAELQGIAYSLVTEADARKKRDKEMGLLGERARIFFNGPRELKAALAVGHITPQEAEYHMQYYADQLRNNTSNATNRTATTATTGR